MKVLNLWKTTWMVTALGLAGMFVVAEVAWSQPGDGRSERVGRGRPGAVALPLGQLGLDDEQQEVVRGVLAESREALREAGERVRASREALRDAVGTGGDVDEDAIRAAAVELGAAQGAVALARATARAQIWEVLTPDQRTAAEVIQTAREQRMEERRERLGERRERLAERRGRGEERRERRGRGEGRRGRGRDQ